MYYKYDNAGRKVGQTAAVSGIYTTVYDPAGKIVSEIDPLNNATGYKFDAAGQQIAVSRPAPGITTTAYSAVGNAASETDPLGFTTQFRYDLADRRVALKDPLTPDPSPAGGEGRVQYSRARVEGASAQAAVDACNTLETGERHFCM